MKKQPPAKSKLRGTWHRPPVKKGGRSVVFWFMSPYDKGEYELTIQSPSANAANEPYPLFPFYAVGTVERNGKQYLAAVDDQEREYVAGFHGLKDIPFRLDDGRLVIERGTMKFRHGLGTVKVDLAGTYERTGTD